MSDLVPKSPTSADAAELGPLFEAASALGLDYSRIAADLQAGGMQQSRQWHGSREVAGTESKGASAELAAESMFASDMMAPEIIDTGLTTESGLLLDSDEPREQLSGDRFDVQNSSSVAEGEPPGAEGQENSDVANLQAVSGIQKDGDATLAAANRQEPPTAAVVNSYGSARTNEAAAAAAGEEAGGDGASRWRGVEVVTAAAPRSAEAGSDGAAMRMQMEAVEKQLGEALQLISQVRSMRGELGELRQEQAAVRSEMRGFMQHTSRIITALQTSLNRVVDAPWRGEAPLQPASCSAASGAAAAVAAPEADAAAAAGAADDEDPMKDMLQRLQRLSAIAPAAAQPATSSPPIHATASAATPPQPAGCGVADAAATQAPTLRSDSSASDTHPTARRASADAPATAQGRPAGADVSGTTCQLLQQHKQLLQGQDSVLGKRPALGRIAASAAALLAQQPPEQPLQHGPRHGWHVAAAASTPLGRRGETAGTSFASLSGPRISAGPKHPGTAALGIAAPAPAAAEWLPLHEDPPRTAAQACTLKSMLEPAPLGSAFADKDVLASQQPVPRAGLPPGPSPLSRGACWEDARDGSDQAPAGLGRTAGSGSSTAWRGSAADQPGWLQGLEACSSVAAAPPLWANLPADRDDWLAAMADGVLPGEHGPDETRTAAAGEETESPDAA